MDGWIRRAAGVGAMPGQPACASVYSCVPALVSTLVCLLGACSRRASLVCRPVPLAGPTADAPVGPVCPARRPSRRRHEAASTTKPGKQRVPEAVGGPVWCCVDAIECPVDGGMASPFYFEQYRVGIIPRSMGPLQAPWHMMCDVAWCYSKTPRCVGGRRFWVHMH